MLSVSLRSAHVHLSSLGALGCGIRLRGHLSVARERLDALPQDGLVGHLRQTQTLREVLMLALLG